MCLKVRDFEEMVTQVFEEIHDEKKTSKKYVFLLVCDYIYAACWADSLFFFWTYFLKMIQLK